jgi:hypothetical protein
MWTVKHPHLTKQKYRNPASRTLFDLRAKLNEQGFNIAPLDVCAGGSGENQFNNSLALPFHECMVPLSGTAPCGAGDGSQLTLALPGTQHGPQSGHLTLRVRTE